MGKICKTLKVWAGRGLSLRGKLIVLKTFAISQVTFLLHVQQLPVALGKKLDRMSALFLYGTTKQEFVKREIVHASRDSGGLGIPKMVEWQAALGAKTRRSLMQEGSFSSGEDFYMIAS